MNTLEHKYDFLESMFFHDGIAIQKIDFQQDLDLMLIVLNSRAVLQQKIPVTLYCPGLRKSN